MDLRKYDTIVVDTAGKMIDAVIVACCGTRQPSIRDWSSINAKFKSFTVALNSLGKNQVYIAHRSERQQGENRVFVPDMREKNFSALSTELDLIGYCVVKDVKGQKVRTLSFDSSDEHEGKNTCHLPAVLNIPEIVDRYGNVVGENNFLEERYKSDYGSGRIKWYIQGDRLIIEHSGDPLKNIDPKRKKMKLPPELIPEVKP